MKNPLLKETLLFNIIILVISVVISPFTILFGSAAIYEGIKQIIEGSSPDIPVVTSLQGWIIAIFLCIIGIGALVMAIFAIGGIINKLKENKNS